MTNLEETKGIISSATNEQEPPDFALIALMILAQYHGIAANMADIQHRFVHSEKGLDQTAWLLAAKELGLKARPTIQKIERLHLANLPALVWREDGQHFILAKVNDDKFLIQDLQQNRPILLSKSEFEQKYSGQLILVTSRASVLGNLAKFDFTWFIPAVIKYRRIFLEVLAVSVVLQLFALITPLFFQVVMDKVLVHRGFSTLDVIAVAFLVVTLFEITLGGLRTYIVKQSKI
ncbi:hypothetical protein I2F17_11730 [Acinetobacter sp. B10A]|uniref:cysteine peptidase family C39 domain-containing protein n=1 Tax=Acinetobacter baretiae TaxID=2605383 RepID=UPI001B3C8971|nr:cysteine peptidase family C39 domain-containing protein [Acinetobacter baretiae]MBF7686488.1 hypothetical protein [Acinetobacter baretiae]